MLTLCKKRKRAMSTGSLLTTRFRSIQYFNPEFDPETEEIEPPSIRSILQERFLEALDASIYEDTNGIVLVLDKVGIHIYIYIYNEYLLGMLCCSQAYEC